MCTCDNLLPLWRPTDTGDVHCGGQSEALGTLGEISGSKVEECETSVGVDQREAGGDHRVPREVTDQGTGGLHRTDLLEKKVRKNQDYITIYKANNKKSFVIVSRQN